MGPRTIEMFERAARTKAGHACECDGRCGRHAGLCARPSRVRTVTDPEAHAGWRLPDADQWERGILAELSVWDVGARTACAIRGERLELRCAACAPEHGFRLTGTVALRHPAVP